MNTFVLRAALLAQLHAGVLSLVDLSSEGPQVGRKTLKVTATLGKNTGGGVTKWFEPSATLFIRFYVKFDPTCDYVHHFCTLRANKSLRGGDRWSGFGGAGIRPQGDERFSTALEPWGDWGRLPPPGRWNFYSYWHEMAASPDGKLLRQRGHREGVHRPAPAPRGDKRKKGLIGGLASTFTTCPG